MPLALSAQPQSKKIESLIKFITNELLIPASNEIVTQREVNRITQRLSPEKISQKQLSAVEFYIVIMNSPVGLLIDSFYSRHVSTNHFKDILGNHQNVFILRFANPNPEQRQSVLSKKRRFPAYPYDHQKLLTHETIMSLYRQHLSNNDIWPLFAHNSAELTELTSFIQKIEITLEDLQQGQVKYDATNLEHHDPRILRNLLHELDLSKPGYGLSDMPLIKQTLLDYVADHSQKIPAYTTIGGFVNDNFMKYGLIGAYQQLINLMLHTNYEIIHQ